MLFQQQALVELNNIIIETIILSSSTKTCGLTLNFKKYSNLELGTTLRPYQTFLYVSYTTATNGSTITTTANNSSNGGGGGGSN